MSAHLAGEAGSVHSVPQQETIRQESNLLERLYEKIGLACAIGASVITGSLIGVNAEEAPAQAATTKYVEVKTPFGADSKWGSSASGQANVHGKQPANHFAQDVFRLGESVILDISSPNGGIISLDLLGTWDSCSGDAGKGIKVGVNLDNERVGEVSYTHLDEMVTEGPITNGMTLGKTKKWPYKEGCWEVTTDAGVHTHFEAKSDTNNYACYYDRSVGSTIGAGTPIARLGKTSATGERQACTETPGSGGTPTPTPSNSTGPSAAKIDELGFVRTNHGSGRSELVAWHGAPDYTTLRASTRTGYPAVADPANVTPLAIDTNGDGIDELAFVRTNHSSGRTEISVWHGAPNYTTHLATTQTGYPSVSDPENVTPIAIDVNGDGRDELGFVRTNHGSGRTELSLWHGAPYYTTHLRTTLTGYPAISDPANVRPLAIDLNGDGIDELGFVRTNHSSGRTELVTYHGAPNYTTLHTPTFTGYPAVGDPANVTPLAIDINGDRIDELAFARTSHSSGRTELVTWHGAPYYTTLRASSFTGYPSVSDPANVTPLAMDLP